jgi:UDP-GlcNAc:undecaprenyl-phosphate GlcNAc-1-phosphate transferase
MELFPLLICGFTGLVIALGLIPLIRKMSLDWGLVRGAREAHHTHRVPVPRYGGLALALAFVGVELAALVISPVPADQRRDTLVMILGCVAMFMVGFLDDLKPLGAKRKLLTQIGIAAGVAAMGLKVDTFSVPFAGVKLELGWWSYLVTVLWLVSLTNLINLVDGVDGLAGGICLMLMALLAYMGGVQCNLNLMAAGMVGALAGFLCFNFPPARIYMGDGGAYFLGFLIGVSTIISSQKGTVVAALIAPLFVLALPLLDTSLAILRRGVHGLPIFRPDRQHIHHRLLETGVSQRKVVLGIYAFTAVFLVMGFMVFWSKGLWIPNLAGLAVLILLLLAGQLNFTREWFAVGRVLGNSLQVRQEIQYALALTQWLTLEGARCPRLDSLWESLVFAARKLGFNYVRLTLEDGERIWQDTTERRAMPLRRADVLNGQYGALELGARILAETPATTPEGDAPSLAIETDEQGISDQRAFNIIADLLAEGWVKSARRWCQASRLPLRWDAISEPGKVVTIEEAGKRYVGGLHH